MPFDFAPLDEHSWAGKAAHASGMAAEELACDHYCSHGFALVAKRWRGPVGEIDLIFHGPDGYVFVEVKKAKTLDLASQRLSQRQLVRIAASAEAYVALHSEDPFAPMRVDLAMVDGMGRIAILENLMLE